MINTNALHFKRATIGKDAERTIHGLLETSQMLEDH